MAITNPPASTLAYRRQKQIEDCLYENLLRRPYTSVSISDLCHQLDISRKSFYNYYPDKDSCFRSFISRKSVSAFCPSPRAEIGVTQVRITSLSS